MPLYLRSENDPVEGVTYMQGMLLSTRPKLKADKHSLLSNNPIRVIRYYTLSRNAREEYFKKSTNLKLCLYSEYEVK
jgi:hypothetical protein